MKEIKYKKGKADCSFFQTIDWSSMAHRPAICMGINMNKKIFFFDIDGTLLTEDTHEVPQSTIDGITQLRNNGHLAFINTGRTKGNISEEIKRIGFDGYVCGCGTYIEAEGEVLFAKTLDEAMCKEIIHMLRTCKIDAVLEGREDVYFEISDNISPEFGQMQKDFAKRGLGTEKSWDTKGLVFDKMFSLCNESSDFDTFVKYIEQNFEYIDRGNSYGEIVPKGYSKGTGIDYLLKHYDISIENTFVMGDSSNDISMFKYAQNCIAMGNSEECILRMASFITKDIHEDGIHYALKHFAVI